MNLHDNELVLPHIITTLQDFTTFAGPENIFLSVFESGSADKTKLILENFMTNLLCNYEIVTSPIFLNVKANHRIDFLAYVRNKAMTPFYRSSTSAGFYEQHLKYDSVIFLNDAYACANDVLELEYQRILNDAGIVGGMDYVHTYHFEMLYDTWVAKDVEGLNFLIKPHDEIHYDEISKKRGSKQLPLQVTCLWNGMVSLNPLPFMNGYRFRRGHNRQPGQVEPGECASSECQTLCLDFIKMGLSRIVMVPRVKLAYNWATYKAIKFDNTHFTNKIKAHQPFTEEEDLQVPFRDFEETFWCQPNYDSHRGSRSPKGEHFERYPVHQSPVQNDR